MKQLLTLLLFLPLLAFGQAQSNTVIFPFNNFVGTASGNRKVTVSYPPAPSADSVSFVTPDSIQGKTDANGIYTLNNMRVGWYGVTLSAPPSQGQWTFEIPPTNGTIYANLLTITGTNNAFPPPGFAWTTDASDIRYARAGAGGLNYFPQYGSDNLTNWSLIPTGALSGAISPPNIITQRTPNVSIGSTTILAPAGSQDALDLWTTNLSGVPLRVINSSGTTVAQIDKSGDILAKVVVASTSIGTPGLIQGGTLQGAYDGSQLVPQTVNSASFDVATMAWLNSLGSTNGGGGGNATNAIANNNGSGTNTILYNPVLNAAQPGNIAGTNYANTNAMAIVAAQAATDAATYLTPAGPFNLTNAAGILDPSHLPPQSAQNKFQDLTVVDALGSTQMLVHADSVSIMASPSNNATAAALVGVDTNSGTMFTPLGYASIGGITLTNLRFSDGSIMTTAATGGGGGGSGTLTSFQTRTNAAAVLTLADVTGVGGAPATNATLTTPSLVWGTNTFQDVVTGNCTTNPSPAYQSGGLYASNYVVSGSSDSSANGTYTYRQTFSFGKSGARWSYQGPTYGGYVLFTNTSTTNVMLITNGATTVLAFPIAQWPVPTNSYAGSGSPATIAWTTNISCWTNHDVALTGSYNINGQHVQPAGNELRLFPDGHYISCGVTYPRPAGTTTCGIQEGLNQFCMDTFIMGLTNSTIAFRSQFGGEVIMEPGAYSTTAMIVTPPNLSYPVDPGTAQGAYSPYRCVLNVRGASGCGSYIVSTVAGQTTVEFPSVWNVGGATSLTAGNGSIGAQSMISFRDVGFCSANGYTNSRVLLSLEVASQAVIENCRFGSGTNIYYPEIGTSGSASAGTSNCLTGLYVGIGCRNEGIDVRNCYFYSCGLDWAPAWGSIENNWFQYSPGGGCYPSNNLHSIGASVNLIGWPSGLGHQLASSWRIGNNRFIYSILHYLLEDQGRVQWIYDEFDEHGTGGQLAATEGSVINFVNHQQWTGDGPPCYYITNCTPQATTNNYQSGGGLVSVLTNFPYAPTGMVNVIDIATPNIVPNSSGSSNVNVHVYGHGITPVLLSDSVTLTNWVGQNYQPTLGYTPLGASSNLPISQVTTPGQIVTNGNSTALTLSNNVTVDATHTLTANGGVSSSGTITGGTFSGAGTSLTGTAASLTAGTASSANALATSATLTAAQVTNALVGVSAITNNTAGNATSDSLSRNISTTYAPLTGTNTFTGTNQFVNTTNTGKLGVAGASTLVGDATFSGKVAFTANDYLQDGGGNDIKVFAAGNQQMDIYNAAIDLLSSSTYLIRGKPGSGPNVWPGDLQIKAADSTGSGGPTAIKLYGGIVGSSGSGVNASILTASCFSNNFAFAGFASFSTNYTSANFTPIQGMLKLCPSNNYLYMVTFGATNLIGGNGN